MRKTVMLSFILFHFCLNAQKIQYGWHNYTTNDGLPSSEVYTAIQDRKGFIWFGTDNGVSKFDGYNFQNFGAKQGLLDNVINCIEEDNFGRIWFGSMSGKLYYFENDSIYAYKYNAIIESFQKKFYLSTGFSIVESNQLQIESAGKNFMQTSHKTDVLLGLENFGILKITSDGKSELIRAGEGYGLLVFPSKNKFVCISQPNLSFQKSAISSHSLKTQKRTYYFYDGQKLEKKGDIQLSAYNENINNARLKTLGKDTFLFTTNKIHRINNLGNDVIRSSSTIYDVLTDDGEQIWTAEGGNSGVKIYNNKAAIGKLKPTILLEGISATSILRDNDGGYWVTSLNAGIFYLRDKKVQIFNTKNTNFPTDVVSKVENYKTSKVFIGFGQGEIGIFNKLTGEYKKIEQLPENNIADLKWDSIHNRLLYGSSLRLRSLKINDDSQISKKLKTIPIGIKKIALRHDKDAAWLLTPRGLSEIIDTKVSSKIRSGQNVRNRIFSIFEDTQNEIWISISDGLYHIEGDSLVSAKPIHAALNNRVEEIIELPDSSLVFATKGSGIIIWNRKKTIQISTKDGLLTDMVENIETDAEGNIWVGTLSGMHNLSLKTNGQWLVQRITIFHGLPTNEIGAIAPTTSGAFLATPKGLVFYSDVDESDINRKPFFEKIIGGLKKFSSESAHFIFEHNENDIELTWNAINFRMAGKIAYRYRIDSLTTWRNTLNRNIAFASLSAGNYNFEVQSQNENGEWSASLIVPFIVKPVWFSTLRFRFLSLMLIFYGVYFIYKNRIKKIEQRHALALQINDLERTALAAQMNPHFIFNCLNSIQLMIQKSEKEDAMRYLSYFAKLVRTTLESTRRGKISVEEEVETLEHYLALEKLRFKEGLNYSIHLDDSIDTFETEIPAMLIQPFVENALKHGLSSEKEAIISIFFKQNSADYLEVIVTDNGKGIDKDVLKTSIENPENYAKKTGIGIALSRKRLSILNRRNDMNDLKIEKMTDIKGEIKGTEVKLIINIQPI